MKCAITSNQSRGMFGGQSLRTDNLKQNKSAICSVWHDYGGFVYHTDSNNKGYFC